MLREVRCLGSAGNKKFPWNGEAPWKTHLIRLPWSKACKHFRPKQSRGWKWWPNARDTLQTFARAEHHCTHTEKKGLLVHLLGEVQSQGRLRMKITSHRSFRLKLARVLLVWNLSTLHCVILQYSTWTLKAMAAFPFRQNRPKCRTLLSH